jgi:hypothetical protein
MSWILAFMAIAGALVSVAAQTEMPDRAPIRVMRAKRRDQPRLTIR